MSRYISETITQGRLQGRSTEIWPHPILAPQLILAPNPNVALHPFGGYAMDRPQNTHIGIGSWIPILDQLLLRQDKVTKDPVEEVFVNVIVRQSDRLLDAPGPDSARSASQHLEANGLTFNLYREIEERDR